MSHVFGTVFVRYPPGILGNMFFGGEEGGLKKFRCACSYSRAGLDRDSGMGEVAAAIYAVYFTLIIF